jgi:hypothetical protein
LQPAVPSISSSHAAAGAAAFLDTLPWLISVSLGLMSRSGFSSLLIFILTFIAGCGQARTLISPSHVTHVDVTNNMHFIKRIDSQRDIRAIIAFVSQRRSGWVQPLAGVPVARLYVCFYDGDKINGHFGVGPGFFETDLAGHQFCSKDAAKSETETFLALIGMKNVQPP